MRYFWPKGVSSITPYTIFSTDFAFDELHVNPDEAWKSLTPKQLERYSQICVDVRRVFQETYPPKSPLQEKLRAALSAAGSFRTWRGRRGRAGANNNGRAGARQENVAGWGGAPRGRARGGRAGSFSLPLGPLRRLSWGRGRRGEEAPNQQVLNFIEEERRETREREVREREAIAVVARGAPPPPASTRVPITTLGALYRREPRESQSSESASSGGVFEVEDFEDHVVGGAGAGGSSSSSSSTTLVGLGESRGEAIGAGPRGSKGKLRIITDDAELERAEREGREHRERFNSAFEGRNASRTSAPQERRASTGSIGISTDPAVLHRQAQAAPVYLVEQERGAALIPYASRGATSFVEQAEEPPRTIIPPAPDDSSSEFEFFSEEEGGSPLDSSALRARARRKVLLNASASWTSQGFLPDDIFVGDDYPDDSLPSDHFENDGREALLEGMGSTYPALSHQRQQEIVKTRHLRAQEMLNEDMLMLRSSLSEAASSSGTAPAPVLSVDQHTTSADRTISPSNISLHNRRLSGGTPPGSPVGGGFLRFSAGDDRMLIQGRPDVNKLEQRWAPASSFAVSSTAGGGPVQLNHISHLLPVRNEEFHSFIGFSGSLRDELEGAVLSQASKKGNSKSSAFPGPTSPVSSGGGRRFMLGAGGGAGGSRSPPSGMQGGVSGSGFLGGGESATDWFGAGSTEDRRVLWSSLSGGNDEEAVNK